MDPVLGGLKPNGSGGARQAGNHESPIGHHKMDEILKNKKPGDTMKLLVARADEIEEFNVVLGSKMERSFNITPADNPTPLQTAILKNWLKH